MKILSHGRYFLAILIGALWKARVTDAQALENPLKTGTLTEFLEALVNVLIQLGIPVAAMFIIYSGFLFVTARGNEAQLESAKKTFFWAIIGTAILLGAFIIIRIVTGTVRELEP